MTIAIASNAAATPSGIAVAPSGGGVDTPIAADFGSADFGGADFAALLLGQMAADLASPTYSSSAAQSATTETGTSDGAGQGNAPPDPSILLATLGLAPLPVTPVSGSIRQPLSATDASALTAPSLEAPAGISAALGEQWDGTSILTASPQPGLTATPAMSLAANAAGSAGTQPSATHLLGSQINSSPSNPMGIQPFAGSQDGFSHALTLAASATPAKLAGGDPGYAESPPSGTLTPAEAISPLTPTGQTQPVASANRGSETLHIETPVRQESWPVEFGQKVVWLATHEKQSAQLTLNPPDIGPIEISLNLKNDQATATFSSPNADVREAIETAIPRLREMFAGVGIDLGQANVNAESFRQAQEGQQQRRGGQGDAESGPGNGAPQGAIMVGRAGSSMQSGRGLVDIFA